MNHSWGTQLKLSSPVLVLSFQIVLPPKRKDASRLYWLLSGL